MRTLKAYSQRLLKQMHDFTYAVIVVVIAGRSYNINDCTRWNQIVYFRYKSCQYSMKAAYLQIMKYKLKLIIL